MKVRNFAHILARSAAFLAFCRRHFDAINPCSTRTYVTRHSVHEKTIIDVFPRAMDNFNRRAGAYPHSARDGNRCAAHCLRWSVAINLVQTNSNQLLGTIVFLDIASTAPSGWHE
jgi:hypothetical protein